MSSSCRWAVVGGRKDEWVPLLLLLCVPAIASWGDAGPTTCYDITSEVPLCHYCCCPMVMVMGGGGGLGWHCYSSSIMA